MSCGRQVLRTAVNASPSYERRPWHFRNEFYLFSSKKVRADFFSSFDSTFSKAG